jgi:hypothetical protein
LRSTSGAVISVDPVNSSTILRKFTLVIVLPSGQSFLGGNPKSSKQVQFVIWAVWYWVWSQPGECVPSPQSSPHRVLSPSPAIVRFLNETLRWIRDA